MNTRDTGSDDWFIDDSAEEVAPSCDAGPPWRILIVDDDEDIHAATRLALGSIRYRERGVELLSAHSGAAAAALLRVERDIALILLDVVMETDDAGLRLVRTIRGELGNKTTRIVLRTGQPGQAPEDQVIVDYDINDYKAKTELTQSRLFATIIASLRSYEGLLQIERSRVGLGQILQGATRLYRTRSLEPFASGVLEQVAAVLDVGAQGMVCLLRDPGADTAEPLVVAATGVHAVLAEDKRLPPDHPWLPLVAQALAEQRCQFEHPVDALYIQGSEGHEFVIVLTPAWPLEEYQRDLLAVFCDRVAAAFDNLCLFQQLQEAQKATVIALADLAETRDTDTGGHVLRVCRLTEAIVAELHSQEKFPADLTPQFQMQVGLASMLHDIGKVATPDAVLLKPGAHTDEERAVMRCHASKGRAVLGRAAAMVKGASYLSIGAQIAGGHHEHYDGSGYPEGRSGHDIPLSARIVAVVDVFDALVSRRPYKEPWPLEKALGFLRERSGKQFDPHVVDALVRLVEDGRLTLEQ